MEQSISKEEKRIIEEMRKIAESCDKNRQRNALRLKEITVSEEYAKSYNDDIKKLLNNK
jgi:hypothetical protein